MGGRWDNDFKQCIKCVFCKKSNNRADVRECILTRGAARNAPVCKDYKRREKPVAKKTEGKE